MTSLKKYQFYHGAVITFILYQLPRCSSRPSATKSTGLGGSIAMIETHEKLGFYIISLNKNDFCLSILYSTSYRIPTRTTKKSIEATWYFTLNKDQLARLIDYLCEGECRQKVFYLALVCSEPFASSKTRKAGLAGSPSGIHRLLHRVCVLTREEVLNMIADYLRSLNPEVALQESENPCNYRGVIGKAASPCSIAVRLTRGTRFRVKWRGHSGSQLIVPSKRLEDIICGTPISSNLSSGKIIRRST